MKLISIIATITIIILLAGCSGSSNPITQPGMQIDDEHSFPVGVTDRFSDNSPAGGVGMLGLFNLSIDPSNVTANLTSIRQAALTDVLEVVDITNFLQMAPCTDCVKLESIMLDPDGNLALSIGIKHPFAAGDSLKPITGQNRADLHVFNVEGIVISNSPATNFPGINAQVSGMNLINADGFSGYLDNSLDDIFPTDATIHPYITHFDDYSAGNYSESNLMGFESVTDPPPSGNLVMAMGCDYNYQDYVFQLDDRNDFIFAVGCTYAVSAATKSQRFTPEYRIPQHNKKAASEVSIEIISNDLKGEDLSSTAQIEVHIVDVSHGVAVGLALNEMLADSSVNNINIEIPGVTDTPLVIDGSAPVSGSGHDPTDPLIYEGTITNTLGAPEGSYAGLIKVTDNYAPGQNASPLLNLMDGIKRVGPAENPLTGLFDISEFATYQAFSIDVAVGKELVLTVPNGGEEWDGLTNEDITWDSMNIPFIDLYYSKDDFGTDINLIFEDYPNTGVYDWEVPDDPSTTVKVKVIESGGGIEDESDDYFTIIESGCNFGTTGFSLAGTYSITGRWTYMGVKVTHQDPVQRLILQGVSSTNDTLYIHNASNPNGAPVASYDTGDLIYCNNTRAFWVDPISESGIDRIIYNNFGSGSPTIGYQLKTIDWDGSSFSNPQTLPKHGSIWNLCVKPDGDIITHNANTLTPTFYRRDKSNNYAIIELFTLQQSTCQFGTVGLIKDIAYDSDLDAIIMFCRNTAVSNGGQLFVLSMTGTLLYQDLNIFGGELISYNASVDIDINNPTCRVVVYAGADSNSGTYWIGRYSADFTEKMINQYSGLYYGPARGELCADGTLWAAWENSRGVHKFDIPPDW